MLLRTLKQHKARPCSFSFSSVHAMGFLFLPNTKWSSVIMGSTAILAQGGTVCRVCRCKRFKMAVCAQQTLRVSFLLYARGHEISYGMVPISYYLLRVRPSTLRLKASQSPHGKYTWSSIFSLAELMRLVLMRAYIQWGRNTTLDVPPCVPLGDAGQTFKRKRVR